jgi:hypothetical protein
MGSCRKHLKATCCVARSVLGADGKRNASLKTLYFQEEDAA